MRTTFAALVALLLWQGSARAQTELECLTEAVLAESTLSKESFEADQMVAYTIGRHVHDGRWGKTYCEAINKRYAHKAYRKVRGRMVAYTRYVCDYQYKCRPYYKNILHKTPSAQVEQARRAAQIQLAGEYQPPVGFEDAIDYLWPERSGAEGKRWFACTAVPLGREPHSRIHVMHREQTDEELATTAAARPDCRRWIATFKEDRNRNRLRKQEAAAR